MTTFKLPDLGEGLQEAEIVTWHVAEGDAIREDQPLVSVETAKAIVEVPSPVTGVIAKLHARAGDIVATGAPLVDFRETSADAGEAAPAPTDAGTVVGNMPAGGELLEETAVAGGGQQRNKRRVKATPAIRTEAKRLGIDLAEVPASGKNGQITAADLERFAGESRAPAPADQQSAAGPTALRGPRRAMSETMSAHRDQVALCTVFDDADTDAWIDKHDFTPRILRATVAGCRAEPSLNGFFDADNMTLQAEARVDVAIAVDTAEGLIVPVVRGAGQMSLDELRTAVAGLKEATRSRRLAPADMQDYTITVSNFGTLAGRYATPLMVPPTVAILGTGKVVNDVVAVMGGIEVHRRIPLSLSFDHRAVSGGEACRFLAAVIADLEKPQ